MKDRKIRRISKLCASPNLLEISHKLIDILMPNMSIFAILFSPYAWFMTQTRYVGKSPHAIDCVEWKLYFVRDIQAYFVQTQICSENGLFSWVGPPKQ